MNGGRARRFWQVFETIHAVSYFHPTCLVAMDAAGTKGFWMGYFAARFAPMGPIGPEIATAICGSFSAARPARALPDAWAHVTPTEALGVRAASAAEAVRSIVPGVDAVAVDCSGRLDRLVGDLPTMGRPLGSANLAVGRFDDPVERLWQHTTSLREHRGDAHVALLVAAGLEGCRANVMATAIHGWDPAMLRTSRAWTDAEWAAATDGLVAAGLLVAREPAADERVTDRPAGEAAVAVTELGVERLGWVEDRTDTLCAESYASNAADVDALMEDLEPVAAAIAAAEVIRYPNPIGLPPSTG